MKHSEGIWAGLMISLLSGLVAPGCSAPAEAPLNHQKQVEQVGVILDEFHAAAARADFDAYFGFFADDAVFIGTDATEHWGKTEFQAWARPFFEQGKTWHFTSVERHIYLDSSGMFAWFDELLSTQMKLCRGSGVLKKENGVMKIRQYVLSMTIPNSLTDSITSMKTAEEDLIIETLLLRKERKE